MTRIIAGEFRGRTLAVPKSGTRPTSDRVREAVFSALESRGVLDDAAVLDLYAGSGALGFEALSRGARHLTAVDIARDAAQALKKNAATLGVRPELVTSKVSTFLAGGIAHHSAAPFDLVFIDPPYDHDINQDLAILGDSDWLAEDAVVVVERSTRSTPPQFPTHWSVGKAKKYGETTVWIVET